jgi:hypothetical protein
LEPDDCMDPRRTIQKYTAYDKLKVYPIGKSWKGDPQNPVAATSRPVLVNDELKDTPQHLRVHEAEKLMGIEPGRTAGQGVTPRQRLKGIGNGWDLNVVLMLLRFSKLSTVEPKLCTARREIKSTALESINNNNFMHKSAVQNILTLCLQQNGADALAGLLSTLDRSHQELCLSLLQSASRGGERQVKWSVLDSGSSRHISKSTQITDPDDIKSLVGFNGSGAWTS